MTRPRTSQLQLRALRVSRAMPRLTKGVRSGSPEWLRVYERGNRILLRLLDKIEESITARRRVTS